MTDWRQGDGAGRHAQQLDLAISVIVPACDEAENIGPLVAEVEQALSTIPRVEIICVDDGSRDDTAQVLMRAAKDHATLRVLRHDRRSGQSRAIRTGLLHARGRPVCVLDGDGQNDPADLLGLIVAFEAAEAAEESIGMVMGERPLRRENYLRRLSSRVANACNRGLLRHSARDVGCGLKVLSRDAFMRLPYFDHMHRFMPPLVGREGLAVHYVPVTSRPRKHGRSKYGTLDRALAGVVDLFGVYWLLMRSGQPRVEETRS
jgi:dolichol-phosphate mannosyltransferase